MEQIVATLRIQQQAVQTAMLFGSKAEWPTLSERLDRFEAWLNAEPPELDDEELELRAALGLRSGRG